MSHQYSILVISEDTNLRYTLGLILDHAGYAVTTTTYAQEELRDLKPMNFDLVFLDAIQPDPDGRWLLPQLGQFPPQVPIIVLAPQASPELAMEFWTNGASGFLTKPVDPKCILAEIHALLIEKQILRSEAKPGGAAELGTETEPLKSIELPGPDRPLP